MSSMIDTALGLLSEQNYSEKELRAQLEKKFLHIPDLDQSIDSVIERLQNLKIVNDYQLATTLAHSYSHKGNRFIQRVLEQKGINSDIINKVFYALEDESSRAWGETLKQLRENQNKSIDDLCRFLSGRNFSAIAINTVLQQLLKERQHLRKVA